MTKDVTYDLRIRAGIDLSGRVTVAKDVRANDGIRNADSTCVVAHLMTQRGCSNCVVWQRGRYEYLASLDVSWAPILYVRGHSSGDSGQQRQRQRHACLGSSCSQDARTPVNIAQLKTHDLA